MKRNEGPILHVFLFQDCAHNKVGGPILEHLRSTKKTIQGRAKKGHSKIGQNMAS
jgi:hypothetical protein